MKMIRLQSVAATKAAISAVISEWQAFQDRLRLTALAVINTCQANCLELADATNP